KAAPPRERRPAASPARAPTSALRQPRVHRAACHRQNALGCATGTARPRAIADNQPESHLAGAPYLSLAPVEPPLGPGPLNAAGLLCVLVVDDRITGMPQRSPPRGAVSQR